MKHLVRAIAFVPVLALVVVTSSSATPYVTYCTYVCYNSATGQQTVVKNAGSYSDCCNGPWWCPAGSTVDTVLPSGGVQTDPNSALTRLLPL